MRRWKRTLSIVMAVVVVFSLVTPHSGNDRVEAASSDNLTGWRLGDTSAMSGNLTDGWQLDFTGLQYDGNGTSYVANISVPGLRVKFNLSELVSGKSIILQLGDKKSNFGQCTSTAMNFVFERKTSEDLFFYILGLENGQNAHTIYDFDFSKDHIFEFVLENGKWLPAIDGAVLSGEEAANAFCDAFVQNMSAQFLEKTTVSFAPVSSDSTVLTIQNIKFEEKPMDVTGWSKGTTTALSGSPESGWQIDFYGAQFDNNGTSYEADIDVSKLQVSFNLSRMSGGSAFLMQLGEEKGSFGEGTDTRINFVLRRNESGSLTFYGYDNTKFEKSGGVFLYDVFENFDSAADHVLEFTIGNGQWLPMLDGQVLSGDAETNAVCDSFVKTMSLQSAGKTVVSFAPGNAPGSTDMITVTDIRFTRKPLESGDMDWIAPLVSGDGKRGYNLENGQYRWSYYTKKLDPEEVAVQMKLSMAVGDWVALELSVGAEMGLLPEEKDLLDGKRMMFLLGRQGTDGEDLRVSLWAHNGTGMIEKNLAVLYSFDFESLHTFALRRIDNAWYLVIDGNTYGANQRKDMEKYAENLTSCSDGKVYYRFFGNKTYQLQEVRFLVNGDLDGDYSRTEADVSILRKNLTGASTECIGLEDVNEDKRSDVADLVRLMKLTETPTVHTAGAGAEDGSAVVRVKDFGAAGDGKTNDLEALNDALTMARRLSTRNKVILEFEPNAEYYFKAVNGETKIIDLIYCKDITLRGNNTTILMDKSFTPGSYVNERGEDVSGEHRLITYVNVDFSENIAMEGLNFKFAQPWYTLSDVDAFHPGTPDEGAGETYHVNKTDPPHIDITTRQSLGITDTYTPDNRTEFGLPYTEGKNRSHMYIDRIEVLNASRNQYRVYFQDWDNVRTKMKFLIENKLPFILGIPYWDRGEKSDGSGSIIVTNTTNFDMKNINVWAATSFVFHMRNNYGDFNIKNCNVTTEPGKNDAWAAQVDIFHLKENRCKFVIEDCLLEKTNDDVFNLSTTHLYVDQVYNAKEFNMYCKEFGGAYYMELKEGDTMTLVNERTGAFVGRTRIKQVVAQSGVVNRVIVEDSLTFGEDLTDLAVYVDSLGQPDSIIRNCTIHGTYRFRTPITIEGCTLYTLYAWIDNIPQVEGPIPMDISFQNCIFQALKVDNRDVCYMSPYYMMQLGTTCNIGSGVQPEYFAENIVFDNCVIDPNLINFMNNTADVSFVRDGREYYRVKP